MCVSYLECRVIFLHARNGWHIWKSRSSLANADKDYARLIWTSWVVLVPGRLSCKWESKVVEVPVIFSSIPCISALGMAWLKA
ncbi:hypothetical protein Nepgr_033666 [Nepenthes gracilis]|uniref:Uncharacterized protein n=1 Tax=Nepenthes gracilis TaxID=150966 RepID=A0AAD3TLV0_NEPGR|nr:hypothetical protein Nepgr_033666 [Nepenthes gracilis]